MEQAASAEWQGEAEGEYASTGPTMAPGTENFGEEDFANMEEVERVSLSLLCASCQEPYHPRH